MKTLVIFYSYTGHTKTIAQQLAAEESADVMEIVDTARPGVLRAYVAGCFAAIRGKSWPIQPQNPDLSAYDRLILLSPVWASNPPPAVNAILDSLPNGKSIAVKMVSASRRSNCKARLEAGIKAKGSVLESFEDIKA